MLVLKLVYFLIVAQKIQADDDDHWWANTERLHNDLLVKNNYNTKVNPQTGHNHSTNIHMSIAARAITIDDASQTLTFNAWLISVWHDPRLHWDYKEYGDLKTTTMGDSDIWKPDLTVYNSADPTNIHHYGSVAVTLYSSGWVVWVPPMVTKTECPMDVTYFPYDTQTCMIYMGSWTTHGFQVDFLVWNPNATTDELSRAMIKTDHHWNIKDLSLKRVSTKYSCCSEPYIHVEMSITMERSSPFFFYTTTIPAVCIALLILVQFVLPVDYPPRVTVGVVATLLTVMMLIHLYNIVPPLADHCPLIVQYYAVILVLTIISIALSGVSARLAKEEPQVLSIPPPTVVKSLLTGQLGTVLFIRTIADKVSLSSGAGLSGAEDEGLTAPKSYQHEWLMVAAAMDRLVGVTYVVILIICWIRFI